MSSSKPAVAPGKTLLIRAALDLAVQTRSIRALGVREIGRQAGLNPNTFYRHFTDMDDLGLSILESVVGELRPKLHDLRLRAAQNVLAVSAATGLGDAAAVSIARTKRVVAETVEQFFGFVLENRDVFIIGVSELHGASPLLRHAIRKVLEDFTADMAQDIGVLDLLPILDAGVIYDISASFVNRMFFWTAEYLEQPGRRDEIHLEANRMMMWLIAGAISMHGKPAEIAAYSAALRDGGVTKV